MDLDDLHIFRTVVREGGVTRAAERLHRVQSNVTTRVQQLEAALGVVLFHREGRRLVLAPAGHLLLGYADRLLDLAEQARAAMHGSEPRGRLRLGSMESTAAARLPGSLARFHVAHPKVQLELRTAPTAALIADVLDGRLDAALVCAPVDTERLDVLPLWQEELVLIAPATQGPMRSARELQTRTLLTFGAGCAYRLRLESWLAAEGVTPERIVEMGSYHAILGCVAAGMGMALVPRVLLSADPQAVLSVHPLGRADHAVATTVLVHRRGAGMPALQALADQLVADTQVVATLSGGTA